MTNPRIKMYQLLCIHARMLDTQCVLVGPFVCLFLQDPSCTIDIAVYTIRRLTISETEQLYTMLLHIGWAVSWETTASDSILINVRIDGDCFGIHIHPRAPKDVFFDVDNIVFKDNSLSLQIDAGFDIFATLTAVQTRWARMTTDPADMDHHELAALLNRQSQIVSNGFSVASGVQISALALGDVCPITMEHTKQAVNLVCGHLFDITALATQLARTPKNHKPRCALCRKYVVVKLIVNNPLGIC